MGVIDYERVTYNRKFPDIFFDNSISLLYWLKFLLKYYWPNASLSGHFHYFLRRMESGACSFYSRIVSGNRAQLSFSSKLGAGAKLESSEPMDGNVHLLVAVLTLERWKRRAVPRQRWHTSTHILLPNENCQSWHIEATSTYIGISLYPGTYHSSLVPDVRATWCMAMPYLCDHGHNNNKITTFRVTHDKW